MISRAGRAAPETGNSGAATASRFLSKCVPLATGHRLLFSASTEASVCATQERHADQMKSAVLDDRVRNDLDNVGVPHPCQQPGLACEMGRNFHNQETVFKVDLLGEEDSCETASSQFSTQEIRPDRAPNAR